MSFGRRSVNALKTENTLRGNATSLLRNSTNALELQLGKNDLRQAQANALLSSLTFQTLADKAGKDHDFDSRKKYLDNVQTAAKVAEQLQKKIKEKSEQETNGPQPRPAGLTETAEDAQIRQKIQNAVVPPSCKGFRKFSDYAGGAEIEQFFKSVTVDRFNHPNFQDAHPGAESVLLFGPPGTGKTLLAEAVANSLPGSVFISISASDIKGKYVGESEKSIKALFEFARSQTYVNGVPGMRACIIFVDEIDGLIDSGAGSGGGTGVLAQFNAETAGFRGVSNRALYVIGATNYPEKMPAAAFQRFTHRIFIGLPSLDNIREILMTKLYSIGWDRINFYRPYLPKWMNSIDWQRKDKHITSTDSADFRDSGKDFGKWSVRGLIENVTDDARRLAEQSGFEIGKDQTAFFNIYKPDMPWDIVDYMSYILFDQFYAPREIDGIFSLMLTQAEKRSVDFVSQIPPGVINGYYQRWLLKKTTSVARVEVNRKCVDQIQPSKFAAIPLDWYKIQETEDVIIAKDDKKLKNLDFSGPIRIYGRKIGLQQTYTDAGVVYRDVPKWKFPTKEDPNNYTLVVTAKVDIILPPSEITLSRLTEITQSVDFVERQIDSGDKSVITMEPWPKNIEKMGKENINRILGISQITFGDFEQAIRSVRSIQIEDVDTMILYARKYGRSVKNDVDIEQLESQRDRMTGKKDKGDRYSKAVEQFIEAIVQNFRPV